MIRIEQYILLPLSDRQAHLRLSESCVERGCESYHLKGLLAYLLDTTVPKRKVYVCHACHNGKCANPYHIYWGTPTENNADSRKFDTRTLWQKTVDKHGIEKAKDFIRENGKKGSISRWNTKIRGVG